MNDAAREAVAKIEANVETELDLDSASTHSSCQLPRV